MGEGLITLASVGGYSVIGAVAYRIQYVRTYKAYKRWQAEKPDRLETLDYDVGYEPIRKERRAIDYWGFFHTAIGRKYVQPPYMMIWLLVLLFFGLAKFLHPQVKVPDVNKINLLERELRKELSDE